MLNVQLTLRLHGRPSGILERFICSEEGSLEIESLKPLNRPYRNEVHSWLSFSKSLRQPTCFNSDFGSVWIRLRRLPNRYDYNISRFF